MKKSVFYPLEKGEELFTCMIGSDIKSAIEEAIEIASEEKITVKFEFNGVLLEIAENSDLDLILRDRTRTMNGYIEGPVGPHPAQELSAEEMANDERIGKENELAAKKGAEERAKEAKIQTDALNAKLEKASEIELLDSDVWEEFKNKNSDFYGMAVVCYSEKWARLMQLEISQGKTISEIAETTSHEADNEGITGFQYGYAVGILSCCWKHGEELRQWHNIDSQIGAEGEKANESGGVLNPAMINVSVSGSS